MFFKNLSLYLISPAISERFDRHFATKATEHALQPIGPLQHSVRGWVPSVDKQIVFQQGRYQLFSLGGEDKLLPMATVNAEVTKRADKHEFLHGRPMGARERRKVKEDVLAEMLPKANTKPYRVHAYVDLDDGWVVIDTASPKQAEEVISNMRETLGSFPAVCAEAEESPRELMTEWLIDCKLPEGFELGDEVELRDPADKGAVAKCRRQELSAEEVREHLKAGKKVTQLALVYRERLSFVLDESLCLRKFKLLDMAVDSLTNQDRETAAAEQAARFALQTLETKALLDRLAEVFSIYRPAGR